MLQLGEMLQKDKTKNPRLKIRLTFENYDSTNKRGKEWYDNTLEITVQHALERYAKCEVVAYSEKWYVVSGQYISREEYRLYKKEFKEYNDYIIE